MISGVKTAASGSTKNFDLKLQTTGSDTVRMVCYSPEKRQKLQLNPSSIIHPSKSLAFLRIQQRVSTLKVKNTPYQRKQKSPQINNRLHRVKQALDTNIYETVDLKVKVIAYTPW